MKPYCLGVMSKSAEMEVLLNIYEITAWEVLNI
eukprot:CAMPEP_0204898482 /NCGR_PEP_ID=MMETSP1397-20131031/1320_1 /ASSEMBLY_ACC=CAM_ASM_000891 /TAXON_ID=49980 /ORGANISM="Climacostomum Climacostomum virens, Strain Stock W-24" /LENGTH=32 /DNA_ID= /DNA_START= /DNA_END= /DNA_ORIENTATION=